MPFEQKSFCIFGKSLTPDAFEGMTKFPSFYEPFLRLDKTTEKANRFKCVGERVPVPDEMYTITEKVDGINCQIVGWPDDAGNLQMVIRGRNELLAYSEGWLWAEKNSMISTVKASLPKIEAYMKPAFPKCLWVLCMELYGPGIQKRGKGYGTEKGLRLFAVRLFDADSIGSFADAERSSYQNLRRTNELAPYATWSNVAEIAASCGLKTVPYFGEIAGKTLQTPDDAMQLLRTHASSETAKEDGGSVQSEGVVLWSTADYVHPKEGKTIAAYKIKFADYPGQMTT